MRRAPALIRPLAAAALAAALLAAPALGQGRPGGGQPAALREVGVVTLVIDRPDRMNAVDHPTVCALVDLIREVAEEPTTRVIVLAGEGRSFSTGADLQFERDQADLQTGGYDQVALSIMHAIANDVPAELVLNVPNRGVIPELGVEDVIELPCAVDARGFHPLPVTPLPEHARGIVVNAKYVERKTIEAATTGSRDAALLALLHHPLVDSFNVARELLDELIATFPQLDYLR